MDSNKFKKRKKLIIFFVLFVFIIGSAWIISFYKKKNIKTENLSDQENITHESVAVPNNNKKIIDEKTTKDTDGIYIQEDVELPTEEKE